MTDRNFVNDLSDEKQNMLIAKKSLRSAITKKLNSLTFDSIQTQSKSIFEKVNNLPELATKSTFSVYLCMEKEVQTFDFIKKLFTEKKEVYIPKVVGKNSCDMLMVKLSKFEDLSNEKIFKKNKWGILEHVGEHLTSDLGLENIEVVIVPGVAFNSRCDRLGHGKGYYDSFLTRLQTARNKNHLPPSIKIGVGLEEQIVEDIPVNSYDVQLDYVISSTVTYRKL